MIIETVLFQETKEHTKSLLFIDGEFKCFILEDGFNEIKIPGETRIDPGEYEIKLRTEGGMHQKYLKKFGPEFHKGMLWLQDVPKFEWIYIHIGNKPKDTLGCLLTGFIADCTRNEIGRSTDAYKLMYPIIADAILSGETVIIKNN